MRKIDPGRAGGRSRLLYLLSPAPLILGAWAFVLVGVAFGYAARNDLVVMSRTMVLNGIDFDFPLVGTLWVLLCLTAVVVFGAVATRPIRRDAQVIDDPAELSRAVRIAAIVHGFIILVLMAWIATSAARLGGLDGLIAMAAEQETYEAREVILDNKLFPGMRLLYTGLICLGVFGACVAAVNLRSRARIRRDMLIGMAMFLVSAAALSILPIFLSQRILLVQMVLSTFVGAAMAAGRPIRLRYVALLGILLFVVWSAREAVTVGPWAAAYSWPRIGAEKLIYYVVNDYYNAVVPFGTEIKNTFGLYTFSFLLYFSTFEGMVFDALEDRIAMVENLRAGGIFPAFTAPYVDFSWAGIFIVIALVFVFTWVFNRAHRSFTCAVIYGQIGGALLLTPHVAWYTHQNFTFNVMLTLFVCSFIRRKATRRRPAGRPASMRPSPSLAPPGA